MNFRILVAILAALAATPTLADPTSAAALRVLGFRYYNGQGLKQDTAKAIEYFSKAGELGDVKSQSDLAFMYETGTSVAPDYAKAAYWARKAAEQGDRASMFRLAILQYQGQGVAKDRVEAAKWWRIAAMAGGQWAGNIRPTIDGAERTMSAEQLAEAQARVDAWVKAHPQLK